MSEVAELTKIRKLLEVLVDLALREYKGEDHTSLEVGEIIK
jgi:hypothetical protein